MCDKENLFNLGVEWLRNQIESTQFGEVGIRFSIHQGEIKRVIKTTEEKQQ